MHTLGNLLTYHSENQRWVQIFGSAMLGLSALVVWGCMVRIARKPMLDRALTVKQFMLILLAARLTAGTYWHRDPELWGTAIIFALGIASIGVMVETFRERRNLPDAWEDPYAIIDAQGRQIARLRRALGLPDEG